MSHFGDHLIIDCYGCNFDALSSEKSMEATILGIVFRANMKLMADPVIYEAKAISEKDKGGYTGFAVITESHISLHSFPYRGYISIDVYTCRNDLNHTYITKLIEDIYKPKDIDITVVKRGLKFPEEDVNSI
jgi:S-adenosylmethionine decarboxylase